MAAMDATAPPSEGGEDLANIDLVIQGIGCTEPLARIAVVATTTVQEVRSAVDSACDMLGVGNTSYNLIAGGTLLEPPKATLAELGVLSNVNVTLVRQRAINYSRVTKFERTIPSERYPNGVLLRENGDLLISHYFGQLWVVSGTSTKTYQLPSISPSQMTWAPSGELVVAFRGGSCKVGIFDPNSFALLRTVGGKSEIRSASGVAVSQDRIFVADRSLRSISVFDFEDGRLVGTIGGRSASRFIEPNGISIVDDRLLAVADRGCDAVKLISLESLEDVSIIGWGLLKSPNDVAVDTGGNLLIMDTANESIAVFREDGKFVCRLMQGFFKNHGNTYSYLACNQSTGEIAVSNNDEHTVVTLALPQ